MACGLWRVAWLYIAKGYVHGGLQAYTLMLVLMAVQFKAKGGFKHWNDLIKHVELTSTNVRDLLVQTVDTARYTHIMDLCIIHNMLVSILDC